MFVPESPSYGKQFEFGENFKASISKSPTQSDLYSQEGLENSKSKSKNDL